MKLLRYGAAGVEKPGLLDATGKVRDLTAHVVDIGPAELAPESLKRLAAIDPAGLPEVSGPVRYGPPLTGAAKFIAIGLNYHDHVAESGQQVPTEPVVFNKWTSCIQGPDDDIMLPEGSVKTDWEVELGVVIGTAGRYIDEAEALSHVAGYLLVNDISEREWQLERGGTWDKGKGFDTFGPIGPWLVTSDEIGDPGNLDIFLDLNGKRTQESNTRHLIFGVAHLISYCSRLMTLVPGDIITTGTPGGVGLGMKPPVYLKPGDAMHLGIAGLGEQRQKVVAFRRA